MVVDNMKKILILFSLFFIISCTEETKSEKYFVNCVKDAMKKHNMDEFTAVSKCEEMKKKLPDRFKYYKGKIWSSGK